MKNKIEWIIIFSIIGICIAVFFIDPQKYARYQNPILHDRVKDLENELRDLKIKSLENQKLIKELEGTQK